MQNKIPNLKKMSFSGIVISNQEMDMLEFFVFIKLYEGGTAKY